MTYKPDTLCVHHAPRMQADHSYGAIAIPIYQTASYAHPGVGQSTGYDYVRESNPTRRELEQTVNALENAFDTVATSSGMAALSIALELLETKTHVICSRDLYGGSVRLFEHVGAARRGMRFSYVHTENPEEVLQHIAPDTGALYIETPSNPMMHVTDLRRMKEIADAHGLLLIVDNTFLTPYYQNPIPLGADMVVHSGTKFLGGHNDTAAGFLSVADEELAKKMRHLYKTIGPCLSPFDSFLLIRGIKTLAIRMDKQQENALKLAKWLKHHENVKEVYYVGLPEHPGHEINKSQSRGFGSMISFRTKTADIAKRALERIRIVSYAESLGGVESLMTYPMLQTHADLSPQIREEIGITDTLLRLSVGIENAEDLMEDLEQALR